MKFIIIFLIFMNFIASASDWRLVEEFDNTPTWSKSNVQSINCWDSNNCYAIIQHATKEDYGCRIYTSSNNGISWETLLSNENEYPQMLNVKAGVSPHSNYYFILSDDNTFLEKSTDGGKTFKIITLEQNNNYPDNIAMYDTNTGLIINSEAIYTTNNGWETFERHPKLNPTQTFYSPIFMDSNTIVMTSFVKSPLDTQTHMAFMKYHLNEDKWDTLFYFGGEFKKWGDNVTNLFFVNDSLGFGCGDGVDFSLPTGQYLDIIYKTTDGGYNWELIHKEYQYPYKGFYNNIAFADSNNGIAVGFYGKIAMTNDGGDTWVYEPTPNAMDNCRKMLVCWAGQTPLIGAWDAGIFRYEGDFFDFPIAVNDKPVGDRRFKSSVTISPNPAGEYIEIIVGANGRSPLLSEQIQIYNVFGECLLTIPNTLNPIPKIDVSSLPSGVYFVKIGNNFSKFVKF